MGDDDNTKKAVSEEPIGPVAMSAEINKLAEALSKAQGEIKSAEKDSSNPYFKSKYADLSNVWDACRAALSKNGLAVIQTTDGESDNSIILYTMLAHSSGQWIRSKLTMRPVKADPQGIGSCLTYARRYSLMAIVGVAPDSSEDDDGNAATHHREENTNPGATPTNPAAAPGTPPKTFKKKEKVTHTPGVDAMLKTGQAIMVAPAPAKGEEVSPQLKTLMELSGVGIDELRTYLEVREFIEKGAQISSMKPEVYNAIVIDENWNTVVKRIVEMRG